MTFFSQINSVDISRVMPHKINNSEIVNYLKTGEKTPKWPIKRSSERGKMAKEEEKKLKIIDKQKQQKKVHCLIHCLRMDF